MQGSRALPFLRLIFPKGAEKIDCLEQLSTCQTGRIGFQSLLHESVGDGGSRRDGA